MKGTLCLLLGAILCVASTAAVAQEQAPGGSTYPFVEPAGLGLPSRLARLTDLTPVLERADLTGGQRTEVLLAWLKAERDQPSPATAGIGGPVDSGWIQAQIVKAIAEVGDPLALSSLSQDARLEVSLRDLLCLALGWKHDARQIPKLVTMLSACDVPDLRAVAAAALGSMGAVEAKPALEVALQDTFARPFSGCLEDRALSYPVREAAEVALRVLEDPGLLACAKTQAEAFARRLSEAAAAAQRATQEQ